jgi:hypothetical protein
LVISFYKGKSFNFFWLIIKEKRNFSSFIFFTIYFYALSIRNHSYQKLAYSKSKSHGKSIILGEIIRIKTFFIFFIFSIFFFFSILFILIWNTFTFYIRVLSNQWYITCSYYVFLVLFLEWRLINLILWNLLKTFKLYFLQFLLYLD